MRWQTKIQSLFALTTLAVACAISGCTKTPGPGGQGGPAGGGPVPSQEQHQTPQGGQDNGGGNTLFSSEEDVIGAIEKAKAVALQPDPHDNLLYQFARTQTSLTAELSQFDKNDQEVVQVLQKVFDPTGEITRSTRMARPAIGEGRYVFDYLAKSEFEIRSTGSCASHDNQHADASVSALSHGAKICFSVENLRRIPRGALLREVLSLLMHEIVHLNGFGEKPAKAVQWLASEFFVNTLTGLTVEQQRAGYRIQIDAMLESVISAISAYRFSADDRLALYHAAQAIGKHTTQALDFASSKTLRNLSLEPKYPEEFEAYSSHLNEGKSKLVFVFTEKPTVKREGLGKVLAQVFVSLFKAHRALEHYLEGTEAAPLSARLQSQLITALWAPKTGYPENLGDDPTETLLRFFDRPFEEVTYSGAGLEPSAQDRHPETSSRVSHPETTVKNTN